LDDNADVNLQDEDENTALMVARDAGTWIDSNQGHLDVVNRLENFQKNQIRHGFQLAYDHGSIYVCNDILNLICEFTV